jgi:hypothetical protein
MGKGLGQTNTQGCLLLVSDSSKSISEKEISSKPNNVDEKVFLLRDKEKETTVVAKDTETHKKSLPPCQRDPTQKLQPSSPKTEREL